MGIELFQACQEAAVQARLRDQSTRKRSTSRRHIFIRRCTTVQSQRDVQIEASQQRQQVPLLGLGTRAVKGLSLIHI